MTNAYWNLAVTRISPAFTAIRPFSKYSPKLAYQLSTEAPPFDFPPSRPLDFSLHHYCSLKCPSVCASSPCGEDREAGAIPALPRNCKREHRSRSLGAIPGKAVCKFRMPEPIANCQLPLPHPHSQSQETGVNRPP